MAKLETLVLMRLPAAPMLPLVAVRYKLVAVIEPADSVMLPLAVRLSVLLAVVRLMILATSKLPVIAALTLPLPEMLLLITVAELRLYAKLLPLANVTSPEPRVPVAPPFPTCKVPPFTVEAPL